MCTGTALLWDEGKKALNSIAVCFVRYGICMFCIRAQCHAHTGACWAGSQRHSAAEHRWQCVHVSAGLCRPGAAQGRRWALSFLLV